MKLLKYFLLALAFSDALIAKHITYSEYQINNQLTEAEIKLNPQAQMQKSIENRDIILFMKVVKRIKDGTASGKFLTENQTQLKAIAKEIIESERENLYQPLTYTELAKITGWSLLSIACLGGAGLLITAEARNSFERENNAKVGATFIVLSGFSGYAAWKVYNRHTTKSALKNIKKINKVLKVLTVEKPA